MSVPSNAVTPDQLSQQLMRTEFNNDVEKENALIMIREIANKMQPGADQDSLLKDLDFNKDSFFDGNRINPAKLKADSNLSKALAQVLGDQTATITMGGEKYTAFGKKDGTDFEISALIPNSMLTGGVPASLPLGDIIFDPDKTKVSTQDALETEGSRVVNTKPTLGATAPVVMAPPAAPPLAPGSAPPLAPGAAPPLAPGAAPPLAPGAAPPLAPGAAPPLAPGAAPPLAPGAAPPLAPGAAPPLAPGAAPAAIVPPPGTGPRTVSETPSNKEAYLSNLLNFTAAPAKQSEAIAKLNKLVENIPGAKPAFAEALKDPTKVFGADGKLTNETRQALLTALQENATVFRRTKAATGTAPATDAIVIGQASDGKFKGAATIDISKLDKPDALDSLRVTSKPTEPKLEKPAPEVPGTTEVQIEDVNLDGVFETISETPEARVKTTTLGTRQSFMEKMMNPTTGVGAMIAGILGFLIGGPIGAIIGALIGAVGGNMLTGNNPFSDNEKLRVTAADTQIRVRRPDGETPTMVMELQSDTPGKKIVVTGKMNEAGKFVVTNKDTITRDAKGKAHITREKVDNIEIDVKGDNVDKAELYTKIGEKMPDPAKPVAPTKPPAGSMDFGKPVPPAAEPKPAAPVRTTPPLPAPPDVPPVDSVEPVPPVVRRPLQPRVTDAPVPPEPVLPPPLRVIEIQSVAKDPRGREGDFIVTADTTQGVRKYKMSVTAKDTDVPAQDDGWVLRPTSVTDLKVGRESRRELTPEEQDSLKVQSPNQMGNPTFPQQRPKLLNEQLGESQALMRLLEESSNGGPGLAPGVAPRRTAQPPAPMPPVDVPPPPAPATPIIFSGFTGAPDASITALKAFKTGDQQAVLVNLAKEGEPPQAFMLLGKKTEAGMEIQGITDMLTMRTARFEEPLQFDTVNLATKPAASAAELRNLGPELETMPKLQEALGGLLEARKTPPAKGTDPTIEDLMKLVPKGAPAKPKAGPAAESGRFA